MTRPLAYPLAILASLALWAVVLVTVSGCEQPEPLVSAGELIRILDDRDHWRFRARICEAIPLPTPTCGCAP